MISDHTFFSVRHASDLITIIITSDCCSLSRHPNISLVIHSIEREPLVWRGVFTPNQLAITMIHFMALIDPPWPVNPSLIAITKHPLVTLFIALPFHQLPLLSSDSLITSSIMCVIVNTLPVLRQTPEILVYCVRSMESTWPGEHSALGRLYPRPVLAAHAVQSAR